MPPKEEPKKKKVSAKEKKRLKELQKREEMEQRTMAIAEGEYKKHEKDRKIQEAHDKTNRYQEHSVLRQEGERLTKETEEYGHIWAEWILRMRLKLEEYEKHKAWDNIVSTSWLPPVNDEADINSFLSVWREGEFEDKGGEDKRRNITKDFEIMSQAIELAHNIEHAIDEVYENRNVPAFTVKAKKKLAFHKKHLSEIYAQIQATIDALSANVMQYLDKYLDEGDDMALTLCQTNENDKVVPGSIKFGLWCGNKLPRIRTVDFGPLSIQISPKDGAHLPKQLNLMNNVAMRVVQFNFDNVSVNEKEGVGQQYYAMSAVLCVETMSVPQASKPVKEWVLRTETALASNVQRLPYPPAVQDVSAPPAPPIRIAFQVPERCLVRGSAPEMGIWSSQHHCWQREGTSDFTYDQNTRRAVFLTQNLTTMAIVQEKGFDIPYEQWYLAPVSWNSVLFVIECRRKNDRSDREVQILIKENLCQLLQPEDVELTYLRENWYTPATMLRHLASSGFNFVLNDADAEYTPDILPKSWAMENKAYDDLALFCCTFEFSSSRHNKFGEDRDMCLFRVSRQWHEEEDQQPLRLDLEDDEKWYTVRYEKLRCVLAQCRENDEVANIDTLPGVQTHLNLYMLMCAEHSAETIDPKIYGAHLLVQNAVKQILSLVRPLTWG
eukprot:TRINITY_DN66704_c5_g7_i1.p1 TRINITY_DN66704_c5_g7~~TRINITY_DN66704_c5_g7_i1.p1  ORF type:complete len:665 (-),score=76.92 TRINITY_DN66704_c5_g7_i1:2037-4031(-)